MGQELEMSPESTIDEYVQGVGLLNFNTSVEDPWGFLDHELLEPPIMMSQETQDVHCQSIVHAPTTLYPSTQGDRYDLLQGLDGGGGSYSFPTSHISDSATIMQYDSPADYDQYGVLNPSPEAYGFPNAQNIPQPVSPSDNFDFADFFQDPAYFDGIGLEKGLLSHDQQVAPHTTEPSSLGLNLSDRVDAPRWTQREFEPNHAISQRLVPPPGMQPEIAPQDPVISMSVIEQPEEMMMKDISLPGCSSFHKNPQFSVHEDRPDNNFTKIHAARSRTKNPCLRCSYMKEGCSAGRPCDRCRDVQGRAATRGGELTIPECIDSDPMVLNVFSLMVNRRCENIDRATLERGDSTIFGVSWPEILWFARIRFPAKDVLINLASVGSNCYSDIDVLIPIPGTLPKGRRAHVPPIVRGRFVDCFLKLHADVFQPEFDKDNLQYEETTLLWQGLAVYHTIAVVRNDKLMYNNLKDCSEEDARAFSAGMCQWAISQLGSILKDRKRVANLSSTQKYFLWVDLFALNQLICKEEHGFLEMLAGPERFSRLKNYLKFHIETLNEMLDQEIGRALRSVPEEEQAKFELNFYDNTLWLEYLVARRMMIQVAEADSADESEELD